MKTISELHRPLLSLVSLLAAGACALAPTATANAAPPGSIGTAGSHELHTQLRHDAEALLRQGAPGVLADLEIGPRDLKVRAGVGNRRTGAPVPWNARFRIGSQTKTFVATVALQLVAEHRLSLDDTVAHWLPGLVHGHGNDGRKITVHELLQHTSGLPDYTAEMPRVMSEKPFLRHRFETMTARQAVRLAMKLPPLFTPGTSWSYSNTNYQLVGLIIEKVTGHSWRYEVEHRIIDPLHLTGTSLPGTRPGIPGPPPTATSGSPDRRPPTPTPTTAPSSTPPGRTPPGAARPAR